MLKEKQNITKPRTAKKYDNNSMRLDMDNTITPQDLDETRLDGNEMKETTKTPERIKTESHT